jgi:tetratricopeptide (TPR) repeat protein
MTRENARLDMRAGRYHLAREALERVLRASPADPVAWLYDGDLWRLQAQRAATEAAARPLLDRAREAYQRAAGLDPSFADAYRQLGVLYYQARDTAHAREAFERYLTLQPEGPDARRIREYLDALRGP